METGGGIFNKNCIEVSKSKPVLEPILYVNESKLKPVLGDVGLVYSEVNLKLYLALKRVAGSARLKKITLR